MKIIILMMFIINSIFAIEIHETSIPKSIKEYYPELKKAIEDNHMHVVYELDLLKKFKDSGYAKKFGKDFNKNKIVAIKTLLVCNGYIANQISNIDSDMMVLCPIKITLMQIGNHTTVSFVKNADLANNPAIQKLLVQLDTSLVNTITLTHDKYMDKAKVFKTNRHLEGS